MQYYLLIFTVVLILTANLISILSLNSTIIHFASILISSGFFTAWYFVNKEKRLPSIEEKRKLIWGSIISTYLVSICAFLLMNAETGTMHVLVNIAKQLPIWIWVMMIAILTPIIFVVFNLSYGWFAKQMLSKL